MGSVDFDLIQPGIGVLKMNRPHALNALTWEAMDAFAVAVEVAQDTTNLRALIVTGAGDSFCAGGDLYEMHSYPTYNDGLRLTTVMSEAVEKLTASPFPVIAAVEGPALGGGAEIALACDIRVMAEGSSLGMVHVRLGISPAWGGGQRLLRMVGYARAIEWLTTGRVLKPVEAYEFGIANRMSAQGDAFKLALELAQSIASQSPSTVQAVKRLLRAGTENPAREAAALERAEFPELWSAPAHHNASARFVSRRKKQLRTS